MLGSKNQTYRQSSLLRPNPELAQRAATIAILDVVCVAASFFVALLLRFDFAWSQIPQGLLDGYGALMSPSICVAVATLWALDRPCLRSYGRERWGDKHADHASGDCDKAMGDVSIVED